MDLPAVVAEAPSGWVAVDLPAPTLGQGSGAALTQWSASAAFATQSPSEGPILLAGCVATPIPGWVEDMRPAVEWRTLSLASSAAERIVGAPFEARNEGPLRVLRPAGAADGPSLGVMRTFVGWDGRKVLSCFVTCAEAARSAGQTPRACDASVESAGLVGSTAPPPAGFMLEALTWAVHRPSSAVRWAGLLTFCGCAAAVLSRRRPRSRV